MAVEWLRENGRKLPWRTEISAYRVTLAEILLQKTSARNVVPVFLRLIEKYPTVHHLAQASQEELVSDVAVLGLPRRGLLLWSLAQEIHARGGEFPKTERELRQLPGLGPYGAAAVASLVYGERAPMIDINVMRILSRSFNVSFNPRSGPRLEHRQWMLKLMEEEHSDEFNLSLVDIGAAFCRPRDPLCEQCPLNTVCGFRRRTQGDSNSD